MSGLRKRADRVFGGAGGWPYGLYMPLRDPRVEPERVAEIRERVSHGQRVIVEWAERYGLRASDTGCCPRWLLRNGSRSCMSDRCTRFGGGETPDCSWLDHKTAWIRDRRPVALTSAPYGVSEHDERRLALWLRESPELRVTQGVGWYGLGTTQIVMWRADRIGPMEAA